MTCACAAFAFGVFAAKPSPRNFQLRPVRKAAPPRAGRERAEAAPAAEAFRTERPAPPAPPPPPAKPVFEGPKSGWGITAEFAPHYTLQGKNLGKLSAGRVFTYDGVRHGSGNQFLFVATFREPPAPDAPCGPYLLDGARVALYAGSPADASPAIVARLSDYYAAHGAAESRRAELAAKRMDARKERNPRYLAAKESRRRYNESIDEAARLEKEMNRSQGQRREALMDELRDLKYRQQGLKDKMDEDTRAFQEWNAANADGCMTDEELQRDALYREHDRKRRELEPSLKGMLPPKRK